MSPSFVEVFGSFFVAVLSDACAVAPPAGGCAACFAFSSECSGGHLVSTVDDGCSVRFRHWYHLLGTDDECGGYACSCVECYFGGHRGSPPHQGRSLSSVRAVTRPHFMHMRCWLSWPGGVRWSSVERSGQGGPSSPYAGFPLYVAGTGRRWVRATFGSVVCLAPCPAGVLRVLCFGEVFGGFACEHVGELNPERVDA